MIHHAHLVFIALCIAALWVNEGWLAFVRVRVYSPRGRGFNGHVSEVPLPSNIIPDALHVNPLPSPARPHEFPHRHPARNFSQHDCW